MKKYIEYVNRFQEGNKYGLFFIDNQLKKHLKENNEVQSEIELILDFLYSEKKLYKTIGYKTILEKEKAWNKKLQLQASKKDNEIEGVDYKVIKDFKDGFRFVKLISKECYAREGKLMSHCVSSYYGRNINIFSLRDKSNIPHATIEENNQVKGKGNQTVDNKYFGYCIEFLEEMGFSIGENEMKNIGYYKLDKIDKDLTCDKLYKGYVSEKDIGNIKDKEGDIYTGFGILNIKELINFKLDMSFSFCINIKTTIEYFIGRISGNNEKIQASSGDFSQLASSGYSSKLASSGYSSQLASSGDSSKLASSGDSSQLASSGYSSQLASSGYSSKLASSGDFSQLASSGYSSKLASSGDSSKLASSGDSSKLASSGYSSQLASSGYSSKLASSGYSSKLASSGDFSQLASSGDSSKLASSGYSSKLASSGDFSKLASSGDSSKLAITGSKSVGANIGINGKIKGIKGTWITLAEYDNDNNPIIVRTEQIDGNIIKENVFYKLKNGEFLECND